MTLDVRPSIRNDVETATTAMARAVDEYKDMMDPETLGEQNPADDIALSWMESLVSQLTTLRNSM